MACDVSPVAMFFFFFHIIFFWSSAIIINDIQGVQNMKNTAGPTLSQNLRRNLNEGLNETGVGVGGEMRPIKTLWCHPSGCLVAGFSNKSSFRGER